MQSRKSSLVEQLVNTGSGFVISLAVWEFIVKPVWEIQTNFAENLTITLLFTAVSIARGYAARRLFNFIDHKNKKKRHEKIDRNHRTGPLR